MKYFHRIPGAKFHMPDGKEIAFAGGSFDSATIADEKVRDAVDFELKKIANSPASMVYTTEKPVVGIGENKPVEEIHQGATVAFDAENKIPPGTQTVKMPMAPDQHPSLQGAAMGAETGGGGNLAASLEAARKAITEHPPEKTATSKGPVSNAGTDTAAASNSK